MTSTTPPLTVPQLLVLRTAATRPDRMVLPLPKDLRVRDATQQRLLAGLLRAGLAEEVSVDDDALCWRKDAGDQRVGLRVTTLGVSMLEGATSPAADGVTDLPAPEPLKGTGLIRHEEPTAADQKAAPMGKVGPHDPPSKDPAPTTTQDDQTGESTQSTIPITLPASGRREPASATSRPGGKLGRVLEALSTTGGATLAELVTLTGWQPHTTRAALTGLRQRGHPVALTTDDAGRKAYRVQQKLSA